MSEKNSKRTVHVRKITYDENNKKFVMDNFDISWNTDNYYISCVQT